MAEKPAVRVESHKSGSIRVRDPSGDLTIASDSERRDVTFSLELDYAHSSREPIPRERKKWTKPRDTQESVHQLQVSAPRHREARYLPAEEPSGELEAANRTTSPSSVASGLSGPSSRKLEWDSSADVGYNLPQGTKEDCFAKVRDQLALGYYRLSHQPGAKQPSTSSSEASSSSGAGEGSVVSPRGFQPQSTSSPLQTSGDPTPLPAAGQASHKPLQTSGDLTAAGRHTSDHKERLQSAVTAPFMFGSLDTLTNPRLFVTSRPPPPVQQRSAPCSLHALPGAAAEPCRPAQGPSEDRTPRAEPSKEPEVPTEVVNCALAGCVAAARLLLAGARCAEDHRSLKQLLMDHILAIQFAHEGAGEENVSYTSHTGPACVPTAEAPAAVKDAPLGVAEVGSQPPGSQPVDSVVPQRPQSQPEPQQPRLVADYASSTSPESPEGPTQSARPEETLEQRGGLVSGLGDCQVVPAGDGPPRTRSASSSSEAGAALLHSMEHALRLGTMIRLLRREQSHIKSRLRQRTAHVPSSSPQGSSNGVPTRSPEGTAPKVRGRPKQPAERRPSEPAQHLRTASDTQAAQKPPASSRRTSKSSATSRPSTQASSLTLVSSSTSGSLSLAGSSSERLPFSPINPSQQHQGNPSRPSQQQQQGARGPAGKENKDPAANQKQAIFQAYITGGSKTPVEQQQEEPYSLQECLAARRPTFLRHAEARRLALREITERREARAELRRAVVRQHVELGVGVGCAEVLLPLPPNPLAERRLFTQAEMLRQTRRRVAQLGEVRARKQQAATKGDRALNRHMAAIFARGLQRRVTLEGKVDLSNSQSALG